MSKPLNQTGMGDIWPTAAQLWRESAQYAWVSITVNDRSFGLCRYNLSDRSPSNRPSTHCQYRYPSPRRSGPSWSRPTPLLHDLSGTFRRFMSLVQKTLVLNAQSAESLADRSKQKKGSNQCFTSVLFSPLRPSRRSRHVFSTAILSAALPALQPALSLRMRWVATLSRVLSPVALLARCVTKSRASAAKQKTRLSIGATNNFDRRSGYFLRGGFAF
jgi:hypothetical protein